MEMEKVLVQVCSELVSTAGVGEPGSALLKTSPSGPGVWNSGSAPREDLTSPTHTSGPKDAGLYICPLAWLS